MAVEGEHVAAVVGGLLVVVRVAFALRGLVGRADERGHPVAVLVGVQEGEVKRLSPVATEWLAVVSEHSRRAKGESKRTKRMQKKKNIGSVQFRITLESRLRQYQLKNKEKKEKKTPCLHKGHDKLYSAGDIGEIYNYPSQ